MKVWVVTVDDYDGGSVMAAFTDKEMAGSYATGAAGRYQWSSVHEVDLHTAPLPVLETCLVLTAETRRGEMLRGDEALRLRYERHDGDEEWPEVEASVDLYGGGHLRVFATGTDHDAVRAAFEVEVDRALSAWLAILAEHAWKSARLWAQRGLFSTSPPPIRTAGDRTGYFHACPADDCEGGMVSTQEDNNIHLACPRLADNGGVCPTFRSTGFYPELNGGSPAL